ncbi:MAG: hypothetical protein M3P49_17270 [Actinomycetota bacterium]|nr:hypothetical protein [Actinomycetota bacterium]
MEMENKEYRGRIGARGRREVEVVGEDGAARPLHDVRRCSPGFGLGLAGSAASVNLALAILADVLYERPTPADLEVGRSLASQHHRDFEREVVAPLDPGEPFVVSAGDVAAWFAGRGVDVSAPTSVTILLPKHPRARADAASALWRAADGLLDDAGQLPDGEYREGILDAAFDLVDASAQAGLDAAGRE